LIDPKFVTSFVADNRGYLIEIRIDTPMDDKTTYTEYWAKKDGYFATWIHTLGSGAKLDQLGSPNDYGFLSELGIDFIPIVHTKFRDVGQLRGVSCVRHALSKIDEANRQSTRLAQMLFRYNKPLWAVKANAMDAQGRPLPAPKIKTTDTTMEMKDDSIIYLPGNSLMESLIPDIKYGEALTIVQDMMNEIEQDLPELRYYSIKDSNLSGKAIHYLLAGAIDKAMEAQGNFLGGLERLNEMALTVGQFLGLFSPLMGNYANGDFTHSIQPPKMFEIGIDEKSTSLKNLTGAGVPLTLAMALSGFTDAEILQLSPQVV
jgi:hypothetical protein